MNKSIKSSLSPTEPIFSQCWSPSRCSFCHLGIQNSFFAWLIQIILGLWKGKREKLSPSVKTRIVFRDSHKSRFNFSDMVARKPHNSKPVEFELQGSLLQPSKKICLFQKHFPSTKKLKDLALYFPGTKSVTGSLNHAVYSSRVCRLSPGSPGSSTLRAALYPWIFWAPCAKSSF